MHGKAGARIYMSYRRFVESLLIDIMSRRC